MDLKQAEEFNTTWKMLERLHQEAEEAVHSELTAIVECHQAQALAAQIEGELPEIEAQVTAWQLHREEFKSQADSLEDQLAQLQAQCQQAGNEIRRAVRDNREPDRAALSKAEGELKAAGRELDTVRAQHTSAIHRLIAVQGRMRKLEDLHERLRAIEPPSLNALGVVLEHLGLKSDSL